MRTNIHSLLVCVFPLVPTFMQRLICRLAKWVMPNSSLSVLWKLRWGADKTVRTDALLFIADNLKSFPAKLYPAVGVAILQHEELVPLLPSFTVLMQIELFRGIFCGSDCEQFKSALAIILEVNFSDLDTPGQNRRREEFLSFLWDIMMHERPDSRCLKHLERIIELNSRVSSDDDTDPDMPTVQA